MPHRSHLWAACNPDFDLPAPSHTQSGECIEPEEYRVKVIVLGGGLMGTASAYFLARRGLKVTLVERNRVGSGATVASFGNIRRSCRWRTARCHSGARLKRYWDRMSSFA